MNQRVRARCYDLEQAAADGSQSSGLRPTLAFLARFVRNPFRIGALIPSSRHLAAAITDGLVLSPQDVVVEYGPGTGAFTACIAPRLGPGIRYLGIEQDADFVAFLSERFPRLEFHHGSVDDVRSILRVHGLGLADVIISGVPAVGFKPARVERLLARTREILTADGWFRSFAYLHTWHWPPARHFRAVLRRHFSHVHVAGPVWANVPPALVLSARP